jgi:hypothetical protein
MKLSGVSFGLKNTNNSSFAIELNVILFYQLALHHPPSPFRDDGFFPTPKSPIFFSRTDQKGIFGFKVAMDNSGRVDILDSVENLDHQQLRLIFSQFFAIETILKKFAVRTKFQKKIKIASVLEKIC